jgi:hypothetical protein
LDFFGVDLGVRGDGTYVFFEANAAMNILTTSAKGSPKAVLDEIISRLEPAMKRYLEEADGWRHEARNHPPVRDSLSS